jgi:hypothetical protein
VPTSHDIPLRRPTNPIVPNAPARNIHQSGQPPLSPPCNSPATAQSVERIHPTTTPPPLQKNNQKMQKCSQRRQNTPRRFLLMSATIRCVYAPAFGNAAARKLNLSAEGDDKGARDDDEATRGSAGKRGVMSDDQWQCNVRQPGSGMSSHDPE